MVALALVVLLGAALIIVTKVFPRGDQSANATPTASAAASEQPSRTPRPSPTPRPLGQFTLVAGTPPSATPQPQLTNPFNGWVRARADLVIYPEPRLNAVGSGSLPSGSLAYAYEQPGMGSTDLGWLAIQEPGNGGWIATTPNGSSLVERFAPPTYGTSGDIFGLTGGADGYLASASRPGRSDAYAPPLSIASSDGVHWQWGATPFSSNSFAWGPAGWLTFSPDWNGQPPTWIWNSSDGLAWDALGAWVDPNDLARGGYPNQLVGSPRGYLLTVGGSRLGNIAIWYSPDGLTWLEAADPGFAPGAQLVVVATSLGFYALDQRVPADRGSGAAAAFSGDGTRWVRVDDGPAAGSPVGAVDDHLLAIELDPATGSAQVWIGAVVRDGFVWHRDPSQDPIFAGAGVTALVSDGQRMAAFGWDRATERPLAWIREGGAWGRSPLPSSFGGIPRVAAAGPGGFVVLGYRTTMRGPNPVIWRQTGNGSWAPEADPLLAAVPDPSPADCGSPPRDAVDFVVLDRAAAAVCLGAAQVTFRAWSARCDCGYGEPSGHYLPAWLAEPTVDQLYLSPIETTSTWLSVVLAPTLPAEVTFDNHWVEVTGHFDDAAAPSCQWLPQGYEVVYYSGRQDTVSACRQQFVVTAVRLVDGP